MFGLKIMSKRDYDKIVRSVEYAEMRAEREKKVAEKFIAKNNKLFFEMMDIRKEVKDARSLCRMYEVALETQTKEKKSWEKKYNEYRLMETLFRG